MSDFELDRPLVFQPLFMERIWGGRRLETLYGKRLPASTPIGESWEIADRPEAQSVVDRGPWRSRTLHDLWLHEREQVFGQMPDSERFPLLIKLLDAHEKLSVQVHPPADVATEMGGEPKSEFWYIVDAAPAAELYVGLKPGSSRATFEQAIAKGTVDQHLHRVPVKKGDALFLPSGRVHAIGAGNVIVEIQQNSDTTYRVFDWNRYDESGAPRTLHVTESLQAIDFADRAPELVTAKGETLLRDPLFHIDRWILERPRDLASRGQFAIVGCLTGALECAGEMLEPGGFFVVPASLRDRALRPVKPDTTLLRVTLPQQGGDSAHC
ncbi:MAG: class I mannose-6-phosphate isomerase [Verrucomicrobiota bacterium]|nr:class I mannose-6-phosphate isomerase [Verrucomicrobiota bacterium]